MKNAAVTEFLLFWLRWPSAQPFSHRLWRRPRLRERHLRPGPPDDAGTRRRSATPSPEKMGGTADGGDVVTSGDAGSDARDKADCSAIKAKCERNIGHSRRWLRHAHWRNDDGRQMEGTPTPIRLRHRTFDGACRICLSRGKYPNTALKAGPTDSVSATAEISNGGELIVDVNDITATHPGDGVRVTTGSLSLSGRTNQAEETQRGSSPSLTPRLAFSPNDHLRCGN